MLPRIVAISALIALGSLFFAPSASAGEFDIDTYLCDELGIGCPGDAGDAGAERPITTQGDTLARTGGNTASTVGVGAALVVLGGAAVYGARNRRRTDS